MKSAVLWSRFTIACCCLLMLSACDMGLQSRFDEVAGVDVCQLITPAEAEHILGPMQNTASEVTSNSGIAGVCTWTFNRFNSREQATLYVSMVTRASAVHGPSPARFMEVSQDEVEASLGASPWPLPNLGDKAILYQTRDPEHSELWMLQSNTLMTLRMMGGSSAQVEQFARALSRELEPKGEGG